MTRSHVAQGSNTVEVLRRRRAAEPRPRFLEALGSQAVDDGIAADLDTLRENFDFRRLAATHPVRRAWATATPRALFELRYLAADLRAVQKVDGFERLAKRLVVDHEGYEDFRFELCIAAGLARARDQRVLHVAGEIPGPDVEVVTAAGHVCGIACYRPRRATMPHRSSKRIEDKLQQEHATWASEYAGTCLLAVEAPELTIGRLEDAAMHALRRTNTAFAGLLCTRLLRAQPNDRVCACSWVETATVDPKLSFQSDTFGAPAALAGPARVAPHALAAEDFRRTR